MRDEVRDKHARLKELDFYQLLGVERDATPAQIKRVYIQAAKRLHPDALSRLGLDELKQQANELFAEIAEAHSTLLDAKQRQSYDASLDGHSAVDANQVAQAEALYRKGEILLRAGNFTGALDFLEAAARLWPEESDYQSAYGWALHRKNPPESERAREQLERAIALKGDSAEAHKRLGLVLKALGEDAAARGGPGPRRGAGSCQSLEMQPGAPPTHCERCSGLEQLRDAGTQPARTGRPRRPPGRRSARPWSDPGGSGSRSAEGPRPS